MRQKQKKSLIKLAIEFVKLQIAGNILFWGTLGGTFLFHTVLGWVEFWALVTASIIAHFLFFIANKEWVFDDKNNRRKTSREVTRFVIFMGFNFFLNIAIIQAVVTFTSLNIYLAQFVSALFFTVWSFLGLRFWVFETAKHQGFMIRLKRQVKKYV